MITVGFDFPYGVDVSPGGSRVYVTYQNDGTVSVLA
jgi:DNA-binding beta-propeller fold protein YncE